jgi:vancomycin resistance protein YoaR
MTGAMLCSLTGSNDCLTYLLDAGGIDIHLIDSNKLSAYQIALNSKNNKAVKLLMDYESGSRKNKIINIRLLEQPIELKPNKSNIC